MATRNDPPGVTIVIIKVRQTDCAPFCSFSSSVNSLCYYTFLKVTESHIFSNNNTHQYPHSNYTEQFACTGVGKSKFTAVNTQNTEFTLVLLLLTYCITYLYYNGNLLRSTPVLSHAIPAAIPWGITVVSPALPMKDPGHETWSKTYSSRCRHQNPSPCQTSEPIPFASALWCLTSQMPAHSEPGQFCEGFLLLNPNQTGFL